MGNLHANHVTYTVGPQLSEHLIIQNGFLYDTIGRLFWRATNFADFVDSDGFHEICFTENCGNSIVTQIAH